MTTCKHADSGCNYPEGECLEVCNSAQHTPGPWKKEILEAGAFSIEKDGAGFAGGLLVIADRGEHPKLAAEMHANAALIASAPELLDALRALMRNFPTDADLIEAGWDASSIETAMRAHDNASAVFSKATRSASHG